MRRRCLTLVAVLLLPACDAPATPAIGVVVSNRPALAAELAVADIGGDVVEARLEHVPEPTAAAAALELAERLAADPRVVGVVGHANSAASLAASQVYNRVGVVQLAPTTTATVYADAGPWSFRMVPGDDRQAEFVAATVQALWPASERLAVVYVNDDYGRSFYRELSPRLENIVFEGIYAELVDTTHVVELMAELRAARPEVLIWLGRPLRLRIVLQQLRRDLPGLHVICGDACDDHVVYENENGAFTGLYFTRFTNPADTAARVVDVRRRYQQLAGQPAASEAMLTYDAVQLLAAAVRDGGSTREAVRTYLVSLGRDRPPFSGVTGPIEFEDDGSVRRLYDLGFVAADGVRAVNR